MDDLKVLPSTDFFARAFVRYNDFHNRIKEHMQSNHHCRSIENSKMFRDSTKGKTNTVILQINNENKSYCFFFLWHT